MQDKALYLIARFDIKTQNILAEHYDILLKNSIIGTQTKNIPYHLTLGSRSTDYENQLIEDLEEICSSTPCIDIALNHIGLFGLNVLFIEPSVTFELLKLQQNFFPDSENKVSDWVAHATLLIDKPETILKALPIIAENFKPFKARIESVELYEFFPTRFIKRAMLKPKN